MNIASLIRTYRGSIFLRSHALDSLPEAPAICIPVLELPDTDPQRFTRAGDVFDALSSGRAVVEGLLTQSSVEDVTGIVVLPYESRATRDAIIDLIGLDPVEV